MSQLILIVEDHPIVSESLTRIITDSNLNIKCLHANNAAKGLAYLNGNSCDLVMLDIMMPKMDGYTVCQKLKEDASTRTIPIIMATSLGFELNATLSQSLGAQAYFTKPFDLKMLSSMVKQLLQ